jgi:hypothetical protein
MVLLRTIMTAKARLIARRVHRKIREAGARQLRYHDGMFLTYPYPAKRGYGTRGALVGIYDSSSRIKWIEADIRQLLVSLAALRSPNDAAMTGGNSI